MGATTQQQRRSPAGGQQADHARCDHHERIGQIQQGQGQETGNRQGHQQRRVQGSAADAPGGHQHDGQHRRFEHGEHRGQQRQLPPERVHAGQGREHEHRGDHEQPPGDQATGHAMHQPAQVGGQLHGLRPRQQHAVVEGVQVTPFREPAAPVHQLAMQQGDLPGRPPEAHPAQLEPEAGSLNEAHGAGRGRGNRWRHGWCWQSSSPLLHSNEHPGSMACQCSSVVSGSVLRIVTTSLEVETLG